MQSYHAFYDLDRHELLKTIGSWVNVTYDDLIQSKDLFEHIIVNPEPNVVQDSYLSDVGIKSDYFSIKQTGNLFHKA